MGGEQRSDDSDEDGAAADLVRVRTENINCSRLTACSSSSSHSTPTYSSQSWNYDVFLNFRGEDTRKTFVDHLYTSLVQQGIYTYKDDETLPRGELIGPTLLKAIQESRIALIVFSENFADSSWCLDELEYIMKCRDERGQIVLPIFYHVDPSEVRKQKGKYGEALAKHELQMNNKVESWRKALTYAGNLSGWVSMDIANGHESKVIKEIVDTIVDRLAPLISYASDDLVGIRRRLRDLLSLLEIGVNDVRMCGIWGVGGGGKTTLASILYDEISSKYDGCCFVENIREKSSKDGLGSLQGKMLSDILKRKLVEVGRVVDGRHIRGILYDRKVLIVLDDVNHIDHLNALAGSHDWFGEGSRIIITTRDEHLLNVHKVDMIHNIRLLDDGEAIDLFRKHAFHDYNGSNKDIKLLSEEVVSYAGGLPLALKVLGSFLCDKDINEWQSALARLKEIPDTDIVEKLKISFDGLKPVEKELFLDIACFFKERDEHDAMDILDACGFHPVIGIKVLIQKALITVIGGKFGMHDLVQEMGHYIVEGGHTKNPENYTRVWRKEDVLNIFNMDATMGLDNIEAIRYYCYTDVPPQRLLEVVANMKKLRWIDLTIGWRYEAALPLPENFPPREICFLMLHVTLQKQLWKGYKYLPNLKVINLNVLPDLIETPDFSGLPNLEKFKLCGSPNLKEFHPSIGHLERLVYVIIRDCPNLKMFPTITRMTKLKTLELSRCPGLFKPHLKHASSYSTNYFLTCLTYCCSNLKGDTEDLVDVDSCLEEPLLPHNTIINHKGLHFFHRGLRKLVLISCNLGDEQLGYDFWDLPELQELDLSRNSFSRLPCSLLQLPRIKWLAVSSCDNLLELSGLPSSIAVLLAEWCYSLQSVGDISNCKWLWKVSLLGQNKLGQGDLEMVLHSMLQQGNTIEHFINFTYRYKIPKGFAARFNKMKRFTMQLPHNWFNNFRGFLIRVFSSVMLRNLQIYIKHEAYENLGYEIREESDEADDNDDDTDYDDDDSDDEIDTFVGYVPFSSLRHATWLNTCNVITFSLDGKYERFFGVELDSRKSNGDPVVTRDCSEFWDGGFGDRKTYEIKHDSNSSVEIKWCWGVPDYL